MSSIPHNFQPPHYWNLCHKISQLSSCEITRPNSNLKTFYDTELNSDECASNAQNSQPLIRIFNSLWVVYEQSRQWCWYAKDLSTAQDRHCKGVDMLSVVTSWSYQQITRSFVAAAKSRASEPYLCSRLTFSRPDICPALGWTPALLLGVSSPCVVLYCAMLCVVMCFVVPCCVLRNDDIVDDCDDYWQGRQAPLLATAPHN